MLFPWRLSTGKWKIIEGESWKLIKGDSFNWNHGSFTDSDNWNYNKNEILVY